VSSPFRFEIVARDPSTRARAGLLHTPHGVIETPVFMPVGTAATVKAIDQDALEELGVRLLLANTYHLYLRPGHETVQQLGGLHRFMGWPHAILTDSGGFQIMSLQGLGKVTEEGFHFRSHLDGSTHFLSPEDAIDVQLALGADIIMMLDQCLAYPATEEATRRAARLTVRWARRARQHFDRIQTGDAPASVSTGPRRKNSEPRAPALFGIVQGGVDRELRREAAEQMVELGFEGYAIGGLAVGEPKEVMYEIAEFTARHLPEERPRYLMGVGTPADLVECVARGVDMFDCVLPTRNARNACLFTSQGRISIRNARYACDPSPVDPTCSCRVCRRYSRGYLRHLFTAREVLAAMLATYHNLYFYLDTMVKIRQAICSGEYGTYWSRVRTGP
jgi:queuine tRNA-ribosyltransferase